MIIGGFQSITWLVFNHFQWPKESLPLIVIASGFWITGGLHLDGLIDTADGMAAGKDKCLQAMKDSRVGASGVQAFILILLIQIASLLKLGDSAPLAIPISTFWARVSPLWAIGNFPYLQHEGSAKFHKINWEGFSRELKPSCFFLIFISLIIFFSLDSNETFLKFIGINLIGIFSSFIISFIIGKRLEGHTGDSYGACVVSVETLMFLILSIII